MLNIFSLPIGLLYFFLGVSFHAFCPFFDRVIFLFVWIELCELFIYVETLVSCFICKDFLSVGGLSFHFVMVSFPVQKLLGLNMSWLFYFCLYFLGRLTWEKISKIYIREYFAYILFLKFYGIIFKFLSHFEFIFVYGMSLCSRFIDLHEALQLSMHHLLKRLSFLCCISLPSFSKTVGLWVYYWTLFCSIDLYVCFCASKMLFDHFSFVVLPEVWKSYASNFVLFPQNCFGNSRSLMVPYIF